MNKLKATTFWTTDHSEHFSPMHSPERCLGWTHFSLFKNVNTNCKYADSHMSCDNGAYTCMWITPLHFNWIYLNFASWVGLTWCEMEYEHTMRTNGLFPSSPLLHIIHIVRKPHKMLNEPYLHWCYRKKTLLAEVPSRKPLAEKMEWEKMWQDDGWSPASPPSA